LTSISEGAGGRFRQSADHWQARIRDPDGALRGSGVLISDRHVLTCAHVLADGPQPPTTSFTIDFPRSPSETSLTAWVRPDGWFPESSTGARDVAVLELSRAVAEEIVPARLGRAHGRIGRSIAVYGHPNGLPEGVWTQAEIDDTTGPQGERMQIRLRGVDAGDPIEQGFSGGGVIDESSALVVGIVVTAFLSRNRVAAWMIPMEIVAIYWTHVVGLIDDEQKEPEQPLGSTALDDLTELLARFTCVASATTRLRIGELLPEGARSRLGGPSGSVRDLVRACRRRSELRVLADLIRYFEGESAWEHQLEEALNSLGITGATTAAEEPELLTDAARRDLQAVLVRQPYFRGAETRHAYLDAFSSRMWTTRGFRVDVPKTLNAVADAEALIEACRPIPGSLRALLDTFPYGESSTAEFGELALLIESLCIRRLLTDDERRTLLALIVDIPGGVLKQGFGRAVPRTDAVPEEPSVLLRRIEGQAQPPDGLPRVIQFAEYLAVRRVDLAVPLQAWSDRTAARLRLRRVTIEGFREQLAQAPSEDRPPVLVIQLAPDALRPNDRFLLSAVLELDGRGQRMLAQSDEPQGLDAIRSRVDGLFDEVYTAVDFQIEQLVIEVIVPRALLTEAVDRWEVTELLGVPLGEKFAVVLRSYDRMKEERVWPQWARKWRLAQEQVRPDHNAMVYVAADDRPTYEEIHRALRVDDKHALVLGRAPVAQPKLSPYDSFVAAVQAGVAYVVWVRDVALADDFRQAMSELLASEPVRNVPRRIAEWRSPLRWHPAAGLGAHVSVLACDFDRRQPFAARKLRPPVLRRQS
jgi:hypothetical protein